MLPVSTIARIAKSSLLIQLRHLPAGLLRISEESITAPKCGFGCDFFRKNVMTKAVSALRNILMHLFEVQTDAWFNKEERWKPSCQALKTFDAIHTEGFAITFPDIEYLFKKPELVLNFSKRGQVLYLPPIKKEPNFVPILSLSCKLKRNPK